MSNSDPLISVIIPCRNEGLGTLPTLERIIAQCDAQGRPFWEWAELIIIDDESADDTPHVLRQFQTQHPDVTILRNEPRRGLAGSYNRGILQSRAPIVLTCHSDCRMHGDDYLRRILAHFDRPEVAGVTGKPAAPDYAALPKIEQLYLLTHMMDVTPETPVVRSINFLEGRCDAFRKQAVIACGLYNEKTRIAGEDQILSMKLLESSHQLLQDTSLIYTLSCGSSQNTVYRIIRRHVVLAEAQAYLLLRFGFHTSKAASTGNRADRKRLRLFQIAYTPLLLIATVALLIINWRAAVALLVAVVVLRLILHLFLARRFPIARSLQMFPACVACDFAYAWGFVRGVIRSRAGGHIG